MTTYQPQTMLVTGGAGFIGANFIRYTLAHYPTIKIVNLDSLTYAGSLTNLANLSHPERHHFVHGDITNAALVAALLREHHIDTIVHFAAESHVDRSIHTPEHFVRTNVIGTFTLLEAARQYWLEEKPLPACRFHHISTDEVYGSLTLAAPAFTEAHAYAPRSPYSASKAGSDHLVQAYHHTYGLPITLTHCSNNYGPYQHPEKFIPTIIRACLQQQPIPIYGNGKNIRDWLYVDDHCRGIWAALQRGRVGKTYHIGGNNEWENIEIAQYICAHFDALIPQPQPYARLLHMVTDRPGHDFRYAMNTEKMQHELAWQPKETFVSGIQKTIAYYSG